MRPSKPSMTALGLVLLAASCERAPDLPATLTATGLYGKGLTLATDLMAFAPQYPLWSDGLGKARWIQLPKGGRIDTSRPESWDFPVGTRVWKEFSHGARKVETRFLWKTGPNQWRFATYAWRADQQEADLVSEGGGSSGVALAPGVTHAYPSRQDCRTCHGTGKVEVLGFSALQLSPDRDPGAIHAEPLKPGMVTLSDLSSRGLVPLQATPRIPGDAATRSALGYLHGNCGGCHRSEGPWANIGLHLWHGHGSDREVPAGLATTLNRPGLWRQAGVPLKRIEPKRPEASSVLVRMRHRGDVAQMPPLGTALVDQDGLKVLEAWVRR